MELYISKNGSKNADGSFENPFESLESARDYIRNVKPDEDVFVNILGGRYEMRDSFVLNEADILNNNHKTVYRAYNNDNVIFDGGIVIPYSEVKKTEDELILSRIIDKSAREHIYEIDLTKYDIEPVSYGNRGNYRPYAPSANELFIDGSAQMIARYPNIGYMPIKEVIDGGSVPYIGEYDMRPGIFRYEEDRCDLWKNANDAYASGIFNWAYADDTIKIKSIDTKNRTITTELPTLPGFEAQSYTKWYIINLLEEIDIPGEYYIDRENKKLYFYPPELSEKSLIQISVMSDSMVVMENAENIEFNGITFENSRGTAVYIEGGHDCVINNCVMRNLGMIGVQIGQGVTSLPDGRHNGHGLYAEGVEPPKPCSRNIGSLGVFIYDNIAWNANGGKNNGVKNSEIYSTGMGGVILNGGDRKTLNAANNYVDNTKIYNVNRWEKAYKPGVDIKGVGNRISHCEMFDMDGSAILLSGNDHVIEYNKIHDAVKTVADAGAIYMGRDISQVGNKFRYNFIYDINGSITAECGVCALYFDDYMSFNEVYGNYFYNIKQHNDNGVFSTVLWNRGGQTSVSNNIFIDCSVPIRPMLNGYIGIHKLLQKGNSVIARRALTKDSDDLRGVDITSEVYRKKYPYLYEVYEGTYKNELMIWNNVTVMNDLSGFEDPKNYDFTVKEDNMIVRNYETVNVYDFLRGVFNEDKKFEVTDFKKIGIQKNN